MIVRDEKDNGGVVQSVAKFFRPKDSAEREAQGEVSFAPSIGRPDVSSHLLSSPLTRIGENRNHGSESRPAAIEGHSMATSKSDLSFASFL